MDQELRGIERDILKGDTTKIDEYLALQQRQGNTRVLYIVVADDFDYNDNYYTLHEGCHPVKAYLDEKKAMAEATSSNLAWLYENADELHEWGGGDGLEALFDDVNHEEFLTELGVQFNDEGIDLTGVSEEIVNKIFNALTITPYGVRELKLADGLCFNDQAIDFCDQKRSL